jgi:signal transduction histidine kinase/ligand-binding sensor domain-containing protein/DNA-binding response OmpR family regulator
MRIKYFLSLLIYLTSFHLFAQTDDITFREVSPTGGFSFQAIRTFNQDKFGYIWMGGFHGVIRYDSKQTLLFKHDPENVNSLPSNRITNIVIDKKNTIWVCTNKGLCYFDRTSQQFLRVEYTYENGDTASKNLQSLEVDGNGTLWMSDENFFGYLDKEKQQLIRIKEGFSESPRLLYCDKTNRMWLGSKEGSVYQIMAAEKRVIKKVEGLGSLVRTIFAQNNEIWVGSESHGARLYDLNGNLKIHYTYPAHPEFDVKSTSVRKIWKDTRGQLWIGSYHGLFLNVGKELIHFNHEDYQGLLHNSIYDIFEDKQGGIWIGTWSGGVAYVHYADNKFNNYRSSKEPASISGNLVSSFAQLPNGKMLVATEQGGLNEFDVKTSQFKKVDLGHERVFNVKALSVDNQGGVWVACAFKGIYYRPKNKTAFIHFEKGIEDGKHISEMGVYSLCKSDSGMWIGTNFGGLNFYNFKTQNIRFVSKNEPFSELLDLNISSLKLDSADNLWASTSFGVYRYHLPSGSATNFSPNSINKHNTINSAFYFVSELSDHKIWMGTAGNGINIYDPKTDSLRFFDANGLLNGKDVYGIIEGHDNNIWITSNVGLILYNSEDKSSRQFVIKDGIQGNLYNPNSIFKDKDENLYFGGTNGFSQLEPKTIHKNNRAPNVFINDVKVKNRDIIPRQTDINRFNAVVLNPNETTLRFNFSADNYLMPEKNRFMYRLTNYDDEWVANDNIGSAIFINVPAGDYIFEVMACNNDGVWNDNPARLPIVIQQFWYKSTLALIAYLIVLLTILFLIVRFYLERIKLKKALLIEKIKHEHEEKLTEMKLRFFTNISHEFRTPLTLIFWPLTNLLKSTNISTNELGQLQTIERNTNRLLQLINQIMDLRKNDKGSAKLDITKIEMVDFTNEIFLNFAEEAKSKNISFLFHSEEEQCVIEADKEKIDKVIFNLLSNAFKYTTSNGKIEVSLQSPQKQTMHTYANQISFGEINTDEFIEIIVTDNGQGIEKEFLPKIFDRFERGKNKNPKEYSTGIGLNVCKEYTLLHRGEVNVQSTLGKGTRFSVRIPIKQKAQKMLYASSEEIKNINSWENVEKKENQLELTNKDVTILVVEDNDELRKYLTHFLQSFYRILYAENGKQGLLILKTQNVQLVISDVMMPVMDGFEFCQTIKSQIETSHIPVILLTALSSAENTSTGLEKGADAYISKPFDENVLLSQIRNLLLQRKRIQDSYSQKFISKQPLEVGSLDNYFLNKVNAVIEKNTDNENFSVDLLAKEVGFSRSQLHRKLKQISNQTCSEYIIMVKIKKATTLLSSKNITMEEVAFKSGFKSYSYFNRCFKKIHKQTPKEYMMSLEN